jgi:Zn-dependent protease with chaperone function
LSIIVEFGIPFDLDKSIYHADVFILLGHVPFKHNMIDILIILVMVGIIASLGSGLYFLVRDYGKTERTVISLSIRVALAILLLILLALGFIIKYT